MAKFVLVDDSKVARGFLKGLLENNGHQVVAEGSDGIEGLYLYKKHKPDVICLDVVMPEITGLDCLKQIMEADPAAKVVLVTSVGKESLIEEAKKMGAKAVLTKPINEQLVLELVASLGGLRNIGL